MKMAVKFSIIVATRNRAEDIQKFLSSLKKSSIFRRDTEIIIVDNNSKDDKTLKVCRKFGARYVKETRTGKSFALNRGIKASKGKYLVFTDDDVIIKDSGWLDKLYAPFERYPKIGYVSGKVANLDKGNPTGNLWERKGGLSKGDKEKYFSREFLSRFRIKPWPLTKICAGANCMIPKKALLKVNGYNTMFGPGAMIGHGESLLIGYELIRRGYELYYNPDAVVFHKHPEDPEDLKNKLFLYGTGDTGIHAFIFAKYRDFRSLYWALIGHPAYTVKNWIKSFFRMYALPPSFAEKSVLGSLSGAWMFFYRYYRVVKFKKARGLN
jgi:GT2 family glycosyltransferase